MDNPTNHDTQKFYIEIWQGLLGLLGLGTVIVFMPAPRTIILLVVFGVAAVKGVLVVRNYMHLKREHVIFYLIAGIPALMVIIMLLALLPDIAFRR